jgi:hypothetical protein
MKQCYKEQWDCATQNSETTLHRTVRLHYTELWDCATQNSKTAIHRTARLRYTEQRDCATQNSETALHRTVRLRYIEQWDCATQNSETATMSNVMPHCFLKNVVPHNTEICVGETGFLKITEFYLHYIPRNRMQWLLALVRRTHQIVLLNWKPCFSAFLDYVYKWTQNIKYC